MQAATTGRGQPLANNSDSQVATTGERHTLSERQILAGGVDRLDAATGEGNGRHGSTTRGVNRFVWSSGVSDDSEAAGLNIYFDLRPEGTADTSREYMLSLRWQPMEEKRLELVRNGSFSTLEKPTPNFKDIYI